jgi:hypothetical protein
MPPLAPRQSQWPHLGARNAPCRSERGFSVRSTSLFSTESKDEDSVKRRRQPGPPHALAVEDRLSNLYGHKDVQRGRRERRGQVPFEGHAASESGKVPIKGFEGKNVWLSLGTELVLLFLVLRRKAFIIIVAGEGIRGRVAAGDDERIVQLRPKCKNNQETGIPFHRLVRRIVEQPINMVHIAYNCVN